MTPMKPISMINGHVSISERAYRKQSEDSMLSGFRMRERDDVKCDPVAHKQFVRIRKLFCSIGKDDDLYGTQINDYCIMFSRCQKLNDMANNEDDPEVMLKLVKQSQVIQRDMRAIEDKNLMNIQSALRSIPKKPDERKNPLKEALSG